RDLAVGCIDRCGRGARRTRGIGAPSQCSTSQRRWKMLSGMISRFRQLIRCAPALLLGGCAGPMVAPVPRDDVGRRMQIGLWDMETPMTSSPAGISVPLLEPTSLTRSRFGDPTFAVMADGSYIMRQ